MGRFVTQTQKAGDTIWANEGYFTAPIWEHLSLNATTPWRTTFGANDDVNYLDLTQLGSLAGSNTRGWLRDNDEAYGSSYYLSHSGTTNGVTSSSWAPYSGYWGITNFSNTGTCANWYSSVREYGWISGNDTANHLRYSTPVIMPKNENQVFEFVTYDQYAALLPIGATWGAHTSRVPSLHYGLNIHQLTGFQAASGQVVTNFGMACYNANTGVYAVMYRTGTSGSNYRVHLFPIGTKIRGNTTNKEFIEAFQNSMSGYHYFDVTLNSVTNTNTQKDCYAHTMTLCDDNTLWITVTDTNNTTSGSQGLRLYRVVDDVFAMSSSTTHSLPMLSQNATHAAHYGLGNNIYYKTRNMMSDDNSVMAVYTHYYYYLAGAVGFFLPTDSVNNEEVGYRGFQYADTYYGHSIAPYGGKDFMFSYGGNKDSAQNYVWREGPGMGGWASLGQIRTDRYIVLGDYPTHSTSTQYQSTLVNKIIQLDKFKVGV